MDRLGKAESLRKAMRASYKMARMFLAEARAVSDAEVRKGLVKMAKACRSNVAGYRVELRTLERDQGDWVPANNRSEVPFVTRTGRRLLYCFQPSSGRHAYLDCGTDMILSDEDARLALEV